ncbi:MAG: transcriptional regulator [Gammaproteobacteria bacterium]|jgi:predicted HTH transcriptional regulator|nr:transcriptional regulator [Gammaproteobacteria bacterium]MBT3488828.1 transcriptional regulator [Gammaproteobacteria bacterium]MBT3718795.1 transcriptional regulator [Gammaproteobacteria bacterium]MBT3845891.1 transcriptional regulator [Gammaproteobacteria bacterium]MBT3894264.1 transcriptional regulator [Gammaproteobacteria bacterium]
MNTDREKLTKELLFHVRLGEDSGIEFKAVKFRDGNPIDPNRDKMAHEIAAFANGQGGRILLGVTDKKRDVVGIDDELVDKTEEWVVNISQNNIQPPVKIDTRLLQLPDREGDQKTVILIKIPRSISVHASAGRYYQRVGSTKQEMKPEVLARLFQQRSQSRLIRFDETLVPQSGREDIDQGLKQRFLRVDTPEHQQLHKLHLTMQEEDEEGLSIAGVLLLTAHPEQWLSNAYIQCVFYAGTERNADQQLDAKNAEGPLDQQIDQALRFVDKNMRVEAIKLVGREDIPQYHLGAVFEAIVNAVAHRDYSMTGRKIRLHLFADRLELYSPGALPNSLTLEGLMDNTVTRNETIVNLLSRYYSAREEAGRQALIERRGEGVPRIMRESEQLSGKAPDYSLIDENELKLTIYAASKEGKQEQ